MLYQNGDPAKPAAVSRLEDAGYRTAILRDQAGTDPDTGLALLRSYAIALGSDDAAKQEVADAVDEVRNASAAQSTRHRHRHPRRRGPRGWTLTRAVSRARVFFVTFPVGSEVYGIQAVATSGGNLNQDEILGAARDLATTAGATP